MNVTKAGDDNHFADINNQSLNCLHLSSSLTLDKAVANVMMS